MNESPEPQTSLQPKPLLLDELRRLIQGTRERVARTVNRELVMLYWTIGRRIYLKDDLQRLFYAEMGRREAWSVKWSANKTHPRL
jgi:hypothetical protein